jgi:hypothetical protein
LFTPLLFSKIDFSFFPRQVFKKKSGAAVLSFRQYLNFLNENGENRSPLTNASRPPSAILSIANEVPPPSFISCNYYLRFHSPRSLVLNFVKFFSKHQKLCCHTPSEESFHGDRGKQFRIQNLRYLYRRRYFFLDRAAV